ncbi:MAG: GTP-binding protein, partial [Oscillospiraceae bacterium]|nr:GTP-binding protein [Oscillospiraceae bacterium]
MTTKVDIFSGFLGAGKTTLIKKLIAEAYQGQQLVLIENEFGEIGIDGGFMAEAGIRVNELNSGCICCSLVGDFAQALQQVVEQYHPDRILIEPSGVGKLSDILRAVQGVEGMEVNSATVVCDAAKCRMYIKNFGEFYDDQVRHAGTIVLSRTGGLGEDKLQTAIALLRERNPGAVIITTPWSQLSGQQLLDAIEHRDTLEQALKALEQQQQHH